MKTKIFQNLSFLFLAVIIASGCGEDSSILPVQDPSWTQNVESYTIPFEIVDNKIIMDAKINNVEGNVCYEANREGVELSTYFLNKLNVDNKEIRIFSEYNLYPSVPYHFELGSFSLDITSEDYNISLNSQVTTGQPVLAAIGGDFFKGYDVSIDYTINTIKLTASSKHPSDTSTTPTK